jgi:hypothetical protein
MKRLKLWAWAPHAFVGALALPFILRQNSEFEWANALWFLDLQTAHVMAHGIPTFFIDAPHMYFYPQQLFYAGAGLSVMAYPSVVLGTWPVFAAVTAGAFIAASAGVSWAARNLGVPQRLAIVPGVLFAVTPYIVSDLYGRGAWAELVAVGAVSVALGAATSLLTGRARSEPAVTAVLALAVAAIAGMHNLTLLFSALLAPVLGVALLPLLRGSRVQLMRRYALVFAGALIGLALCGAFLVPNIWLSGRTVISSSADSYLRQINGFDQLSVIFDPLTGQPTGTVNTDLHTQTAVAALIWFLGAAALAAARRWLDRRTQVTLVLLGLAGLGTTLLITNPSWWLSFPSTLRAIQFPFRLVTYLALLTVLGIVVLLTNPALRRSRLTIALLLLATAWQVGLGAGLALTAKPVGASTAPTPQSVRAGSIPPAFLYRTQSIEFRLITKDPVNQPSEQAQVAPIGDDTPPQIQLSGSQPTGSLVATRVVASPLIRFTGDVSVAGAAADGFEVLRVNRSPWHATVGPVCSACLGALIGGDPLALLAGRFMSLAGALALFCLILAAIPGSRRTIRGLWRRVGTRRRTQASSRA